MEAMDKHPRRAILRGALLGAAGVGGAVLSACTDFPAPSPLVSSTAEDEPSGAVLLAYFSRAGENYFYGGRKRITVGNTEVVAGMISRLIGCDAHRIAAADPYPEDYEPTVARNVREQQANARPAIANPLDSIARYDTVLLGSPIWNVRAPMIMTTFVEGLDFHAQRRLPHLVGRPGCLRAPPRHEMLQLDDTEVA
jgi:flavodoxin